MIQWKFADGQFTFFIPDGGGLAMPLSTWNREELLSQAVLLEELADNGFATSSEVGYEADAEAVLRMSELDQRILGLPQTYPYAISILSDGQLNQSSFRFVCRFSDFVPGGNLLHIIRDGPLLTADDKTYLLSAAHFAVCEALDGFNAMPDSEHSFKEHLLHFSKIKSLADEAGIHLDSYLQGQELLVPQKIKADFQVASDGTLEVFPVVDVADNSSFVRAYDKFPAAREIYPIADNTGTTTRVVIDEAQQAQLQQMKRVRRVRDRAQIAAIIKNPTEYFSPETDLSEFYSERVIELGIYKPKFYPFVCPYKSEWIPGFAIQAAGSAEQRVTFESEESLNEFETAVNAAQDSGAETFVWEGADVPVAGAAALIRVARKQFAQPEKPLPDDTTDSEGRKVLIVYENADALEYAPGHAADVYDYHGFTPVQNLASGITLKEHQVAGVAWLQTLCKARHPGCLLADDMGLGKTLQLLYFIEWHARHFNPEGKPYLVVAPVSLLENWEAEYKRFFSPCTLRLNPLHGGVQVGKSFSPDTVAALQQPQIILTNYETMRTYQLNLCAVNYAVVVLDEAQKIKTPGTLITNVVKAIKADFRIAMTGTPIENTFVDLWCIMDFSVPGLLGFAKDFSKQYQQPLKEEGTDVAALGQQLHERTGIFLKRRMKRDVLKDLPEKVPQIIRRAMPPVQIQRYREAVGAIKEGNDSSPETGADMLRVLHAIRDISDHPFLANGEAEGKNTAELIATSAKLQLTVELLHIIRDAGEKVIVFADRKGTQRILQQAIRDTFGITLSIINGDTPTTRRPQGANHQSRQQTIDRFSSQKGFGVIIMSPLAAGVGLNVTAANHVIHYSRHWNPAKEEQATDRAYRIGQTKAVHVYYPMAVFPEQVTDGQVTIARAFDEVLDALLSRKMSLATSTLYPTEQTEVRADEMMQGLFGKEVLPVNELAA